VITFHFFTDFIETETACQWQICNKKPLTCQILVHNKHYLDQRGLYTKRLNILFENKTMRNHFMGYLYGFNRKSLLSSGNFPYYDVITSSREPNPTILIIKKTIIQPK
jgi:hypothetical protein